MRLVRRRPVLPAADRAGLRTAAAELGVADRALAVAVGPDPDRPGGVCHVVALPTHLAYGSGEAWTLIPWDEIDLGRWNADTDTLEVDQRGPLLPLGDDAGTTSDSTAEGALVARSGHRHRIRLTHPERVAQVMAERVAATILFHRTLPMPGRGTSLTVVARRRLTDQQIQWLASPGRGMRTNDPEVQAYAAAAVRRLRREYA